MYCKWCGMDTRDEKKCEWCGRSLAAPSDETPAAKDGAPPPADTKSLAPPPPKAASPPSPAPEAETPQSSSGWVGPKRVEAPPPAEETPHAEIHTSSGWLAPPKEEPAPPAEEHPAAPVHTSTGWVGPSKEEPDKPAPPAEEHPAAPVHTSTGSVGPHKESAAEPTTVMPAAPPTGREPTTSVAVMEEDPNAGLPTHKASHLKPIKIDTPEVVPFGIRFQKYLSVMLILLAGGIALAHYKPEAWLGALLPLLFISGLLMAVYRVINFYENDFSDVLILLLATMFVGPVYSLLVYGFISFLRSDANYSLIGLVGSYLVIRFIIGCAAHGLVDTATYMATFQISLSAIPRMLQLFPACVLVGGWMCASFAAPLNE